VPWRGSSDEVVASHLGKLDFDASTGEAPASFRLWRVKGKTFVRDRRLE